MGELIWAYYEVGRGVEAPFPSAADAAYLSGYPLLLAGILHLGSPSRKIARIRTALDALIVAVVAAAPVWYYILRPIASVSDSPVVESLLAMAYPAGDLLLLFGVSFAAFKHWSDRTGATLGALSLGLLLFLTADLAFALLSTNDTFITGSLVDIGWLAGYCLIAISAIWQVNGRSAVPAGDQARLAPAWRQVAPLLLLLPAVSWLALISRSGSGHDFVTILVLAAVLLVTVRSMVAVGDILALNSELAAARSRLESSNEELRKKSRRLNTLLLDAVDQSRKDSLTGLLNHGAVLEDLARAIRGKPRRLLLALLDVDNLKLINDSAGHQAGDAVLRDAADRLLTLGDSVVGRYGGDEFLAFTLRSDLSTTEYKASIEEALDGLSAQLPKGEIRVSLSCGVAAFPENAQDVESLVGTADTWLYVAKAVRHPGQSTRLNAA